MFENVLNLFSNDERTQAAVSNADANHTFGALMVRAAKADRAYLFE